MSRGPSRLSQIMQQQAAARAAEPPAASDPAPPTAPDPTPLPALQVVAQETGAPSWLPPTSVLPPAPPPVPEDRAVVGYIVARRTALNVRGTSVYLEAGKMVTEPMLVQSMIDNRVDMTPVLEGDDVVACPHCQRSFLAEFGRTIARHLGLRSAA